MDTKELFKNRNNVSIPSEICYDSLIITELIRIEDFNDLIISLQRIYDQIDPVEFNRISGLEEEIKDKKSRLFNNTEIILPFISDNKLSRIPFNRVYHDLGDYIHTLQIHIGKLTPSSLLLKVHVLLTSKATEELKKRLNADYDQVEQVVNTPRGSYLNIKNPLTLKKEAIIALRQEIKDDIIKFMSDFNLEGYFMSFEDRSSTLQSIDVFSLNFPIDDKQWLEREVKFLGLFSADIQSTSKYNDYLLMKEEGTNITPNYIIFANRSDLTDCPSVDLVVNLTSFSFSYLAIERWVELQERFLGKLNEIVSKEIQYLNKSDIKSLLDKRGKIQNKIFNFRRFSAELTNNYTIFNIDHCNFISLDSGRDHFKELDLFNKILYTKDMIEVYLNHSNSNLKLKNIEYNEKTQSRVHYLTIVVVVLTSIQIGLLILDSESGAIILQLLNLFWLIKSLTLPFILPI